MSDDHKATALSTILVLAWLAPGRADAQLVPAPPQPVIAAREDQPVEPRQGESNEGDEIAQLRDDIAELKNSVQAANETIENATLEALKDPPVRIYGFIDMGLRKEWIPKNGGVNQVAPTRATTFLLGNVNLYFDFKPTPAWGALVEIRLTNYPDGVDTIGTPFRPYNRTDTTIEDTNNGDGFDQIKYSSLVLERAYIEWGGHDKLNARIGYFLTPAGIWNVDHGTPTLIPINFPEVITSELYPRKQLGVELYGTALRRGSWTVSYNAYVSNGRTPGQWDLTEDKMLGGRLYATTRIPHTIVVGLSGYRGRFSDQTRAITSFMPFTIERTETVAYDEFGVGADLTLDLGPWRVRTEGVVHRQNYFGGKSAPTAVPGVFAPDRTQVDVYAIAARSIGHGLEPYLYLEYFKAEEEFAKYIIAPSIGLNYHINGSTILKFQYHRDLPGDSISSITAPSAVFGTGIGFHLLAARLVLAF
jgi:hypothetical protein